MEVVSGKVTGLDLDSSVIIPDLYASVQNGEAAMLPRLNSRTTQLPAFNTSIDGHILPVEQQGYRHTLQSGTHVG